ncbi:MAG: glycosyltransferase involved in cell wall biosynthesis [Sphingobacteriales bacterium]|jgi:glycosyltransferase involved in cell wall biosynthesis
MTDKKIKVLFFPAWYPTKYDPMAGLFVQNHAKAVSNFCDVAVLYAQPIIDLKDSQKISIENYQKFNEVRVFYRKSNSKIISFYRLCHAYSTGYKKLRAIWGKPDINHVHILTRAAIPALYLKFVNKIPFGITEHWSRYLPENFHYRGFIRKTISNMAIRKSSFLTTVSEVLYTGMKNCGLAHKNHSIISNVVDFDRFELSTSTKNDVYTFLHVSCFDEKAKNIKGIISAFDAFSKNNSKIELQIVGSGPNFNEVFKYSKKFKSNILFKGVLEGDKLLNAYKNCDAFVLFSNFESQGIVLIEALACGKPVIATKVGGIPEIITSNNGILVSPGNEKELAKAMSDVHTNKITFDPTLLRKSVVDKFDSEKIGKKFYTLYLNTLNA